MDMLHLAYALVGVLGVLLALVSVPIREVPFSEPMAALLLGIVVGPAVLGVLEVSASTRDVLLLEGTRILLAASVMAAALRFPTSGLRSMLRPVGLLLLVVMPLAAALAGVSALALGLPLALAFLVGACLAPTDPVLAASVVSGAPAERDLPGRLRRLLTLESGANDGLALAVVGIAVAAVLPGKHLTHALQALAWEVVAGTLIGLAVGLLAGWGLRCATAHRDLGRGPELLFTLLLALATLGVARVAATDGVLAVFVAGLAYNRLVSGSERGVQSGIDEAVNRFAVLPVFILLGSTLPWAELRTFGWPALAFVAGVLLLRRPVLVLLLARPTGLRLPDAAFTGWFGPMGVSALFYLGHSLHEGVGDPRLYAAVSLAVAASVVAFGVTQAPLRHAYAAREETRSDRAAGRGERRAAPR
jgi:NhaP-type Na+/H+ or K+/H+ antiporter